MNNNVGGLEDELLQIYANLGNTEFPFTEAVEPYRQFLHQKKHLLHLPNSVAQYH